MTKINPMTFKNKALLSALKGANSILLCTHMAPDGDAIGSILAMRTALLSLGKSVTAACHNESPRKLSFLQGADQILQAEALEGKTFDLAMALDAADLQRLGACAEAFSKVPVRVQVDHHGTNPEYAMENEVDPKAAATGCIVWRLLKTLNIQITQDIAECLYVAVSSDTGNFCFGNSNEEAFLCAGAMVQTGFDLSAAARNAHLIHAREHVALLGCALRSMHFFANDSCSGMKLKMSDYALYNATDEQSDGIVNYGLDMPNIKIAYMADERKDFVKFSLRAIPPYNVSVIAQQFGGGGHVLASGCKMDCALDEACKRMEAAITAQIGEVK